MPFEAKSLLWLIAEEEVREIGMRRIYRTSPVWRWKGYMRKVSNSRKWSMRACLPAKKWRFL